MTDAIYPEQPHIPTPLATADDPDLGSTDVASMPRTPSHTEAPPEDGSPLEPGEKRR